MDEQPEWRKIHLAPDQPLLIDTVAKEVVLTAVTAQQEIPDLGAILLESTDLPPFAKAIRECIQIPVFDLSTMVTLIHTSFS